MTEDDIRAKAAYSVVAQRLSAAIDDIANLSAELAVMQDRYNKAQAKILELETPKPE